MSGESIPIAVLAGGLATRLKPLTCQIPKSLLDLNGKPFIWHQLQLLKASGVDRVVLCVGHLGEMIRNVVGNGSDLGMDVRYSFDGPTLLGTAGALRNALPLLGEAFLVMYGDSYLVCDYQVIGQAFEASGRKALMTVYRNDGRYDRSNIEYAKGRILAYDKKNQDAGMRHIDYGLGGFRADAFEVVPHDRPFDLADLYRVLLSRGELAAYEVSERFYEIGSPEGLEETRDFLRRRAAANE